ncbi:MAG: DUF882 domain-containing protein [Hyphomicrobiaceae bacterium]
MGSPEITAASGQTRSISLYNIHNKETTTVLFKKDGQYIQSALDKINWAMRDWRKDEQTKMDPSLVDLLWEIHAELGSREPIHIISAFRSRGTNDMLRKTVGGQASESRHILGRAADVHFPDVPLKNLRYSALIRERGGVGYYPTSAIPFVHVDTDRVRHWPRLPRYELALLFPNGETKHQPSEGGAISIEDVRVAQARHRDLAVQVAAFHDNRNSPPTSVAVAALDRQPARPTRTLPSAQMAALAPTVPEADRPSRLTGPTDADRSGLSSLLQNVAIAPEPQLIRSPTLANRNRTAEPRMAALTPPALPKKLTASDVPENSGWGNGFVQAPAFDEEHPEELSYRPFPISPLLTVTASADDPALLQMTHPDVARTFDLLDSAGSMPPMRMRPSTQIAAAMWSQSFAGEAINLNALQNDGAVGLASLKGRSVKTQ